MEPNGSEHESLSKSPQAILDTLVTALREMNDHDSWTEVGATTLRDIYKIFSQLNSSQYLRVEINEQTYKRLVRDYLVSPYLRAVVGKNERGEEKTAYFLNINTHTHEKIEKDKYTLSLDEPDIRTTPKRPPQLPFHIQGYKAHKKYENGLYVKNILKIEIRSKIEKNSKEIPSLTYLTTMPEAPLNRQ